MKRERSGDTCWGSRRELGARRRAHTPGQLRGALPGMGHSIGKARGSWSDGPRLEYTSSSKPNGTRQEWKPSPGAGACMAPRSFYGEVCEKGPTGGSRNALSCAGPAAKPVEWLALAHTTQHKHEEPGQEQRDESSHSTWSHAVLRLLGLVGGVGVPTAAAPTTAGNQTRCPLQT